MSWFGNTIKQKAALRLLIDNYIDRLFQMHAPAGIESAVCNMLCHTAIGQQLVGELPLGEAIVQVSAFFKKGSNEDARLKVKGWCRKRLGV